MPYLIAVLALVILVLLWFISTQKRLVSQDELCSNALSQIAVQQSSRFDALTQIAKLIKQYDAHEASTLQSIIEKRMPSAQVKTVQDIAAQETLLEEISSKVFALAESYPQLKADTLYAQAIESVHRYEDNVRKSRMVYNDTVTRFNRSVRALPSSIIASMLHFSTKEYLQEDPGKSEMPEM